MLIFKAILSFLKSATKTTAGQISQYEQHSQKLLKGLFHPLFVLLLTLYTLTLIFFVVKLKISCVEILSFVR